MKLIQTSSRAFRWSLCSLYTALLALLSLTSSSTFAPIPVLFEGEDKVAHLGMYGVYAFLLVWASGAGCAVRQRTIIGMALYSSAFGLLMELLQGLLMPNDRSCSMLDAAAKIGRAFIVAGWENVTKRKASDS